MNSFAPINRVPMDVLSIIPTHLPSQGDRFRASFVCRHWRRTLLRHAALWSYLILSKGEVYVKTLLERAKGSPLAILAGRKDPTGAIMLLPPHTERITDVELANTHWEDIQMFSEITSGPLPLLHALDINAVLEIDPEDSEEMTAPSHPLFTGAVDLKEFRLHSDWSPFLSHFVFPNLTSFELSVASTTYWEHRSSELLDFLEASPMLRVVHMKIAGYLSMQDVPQERIVVLHNVESLRLVVGHSGLIVELAARISCPSVKDTSFAYMGKGPTLVEAFPGSVLWGLIIRQYTRNPIEEITLEIKDGVHDTIACSLTLLSPDPTVFSVHYQVSRDDEDQYTSEWSSFSEIYCDFFFDVSSSVETHALLTNVKRFRVCDLLHPFRIQSADITNKLGELLRSLGPLEDLTLCRCDMRFFPSHRYSGTHRLKKPVAYPLIKVLTISDPLEMCNEDVVTCLVEFARVQHESGVPFERVTIRMNDPPAGMEERLRPWVGVVNCCGSV